MAGASSDVIFPNLYFNKNMTLKAFNSYIHKSTEESIDKKKGQFMTFSLIFCCLLSALDNKKISKRPMIDRNDIRKICNFKANYN